LNLGLVIVEFVIQSPLPSIVGGSSVYQGKVGVGGYIWREEETIWTLNPEEIPFPFASEKKPFSACSPDYPLDIMSPTTILITGGNRGIGLGIVTKFLSQPNHASCTTPDP
jgi:hypothetical protein